MKYLIVFIMFFSSFLAAQDVPTFEESAEQVGIEEVEAQEPQEAPIEPASEIAPTEIELPGNSGTPESSGNTGSSDFDVFQPSEDISEDLSVPFPADI